MATFSFYLPSSFLLRSLLHSRSSAIRALTEAPSNHITQIVLLLQTHLRNRATYYMRWTCTTSLGPFGTPYHLEYAHAGHTWPARDAVAGLQFAPYASESSRSARITEVPEVAACLEEPCERISASGY